MSLHVRTLGHGPPLVCVHGWGLRGAVWDDIAASLAETYRVHLVDLPGHGLSAALPEGEYTLEKLAALLAARCPAPAIWVGWSLGGLLALQIALDHPRQVRGLALVAATPRFVRAADWPAAIPPEVLAGFAAQLRDDYDGTLQRFLALQVRGAESGRENLRRLKMSLAQHRPAPGALEAGLALLADSDLRAFRPACPAWLGVGERDTLVPAGVLPAWRALWPALRGQVFPGAGHVPFLSHPQAFLTALHGFLHDCA